MKRKVAIIGTGKIARYLKQRLEDMKLEVCFMINRSNSNSFELLLKTEKPKAVFLTISTLDKGEKARDYILLCAKYGVPVITCEKGALAYHMLKLWEHLETIGHTACVGGGTGIIQLVKNLNIDIKEKIEIEVVLNGTLNYIFHQMASGISLEEACDEARRLGYAEPNATDSLSLVNGELKDVIMKTCAFFNTALANGRFITPHEFGKFELSSADLEKLQAGDDYRMMVFFSNHKILSEPHFVGKKFRRHKIGGKWDIMGGFVSISNSNFYPWIPGGVGNAVHVIDKSEYSFGECMMSGQGAGVRPTVAVMLEDYRTLCWK